MSRNLRLTLITFLLGIFMGALDQGIVSPALTVLAKELHINFQWTVWIVTAYTLVYAVSMPIVGKMSDLFGHKRVFMIGVTLFAIGSIISGTAQSLVPLLIGRAIQAIGGGGIIPIANAVIGNSFPKEKRGMALGLIGAMFGVATIIGPNIGSLFVVYFSWRWIFFINIPISIIILILGTRIKTQKPDYEKKPLDIMGGLVLSAVIVMLLLGLTNLNTNDIEASLTSIKVWPLLAAAIFLIYPFIKIEQKAKDPIVKLSYFKNKNIVLALFISMITGIGIISTIFIPAFSETLLGLSSGKGGYVITILALASGIASPIGGNLLDKWNAKKVVVLGFIFSLIGALILALAATGWWTLALGLAISGVGIGFTMGAPLNYIILELTPASESGFALSLVSLFRSIGTAIGPVILVSFIAGSTAKLQHVSKESEDVVNNIILSGYEHLYLAAAAIFLIGILLSLGMKLKRVD